MKDQRKKFSTSWALHPNVEIRTDKELKLPLRAKGTRPVAVCLPIKFTPVVREVKATVGILGFHIEEDDLLRLSDYVSDTIDYHDRNCPSYRKIVVSKLSVITPKGMCRVSYRFPTKEESAEKETVESDVRRLYDR